VRRPQSIKKIDAPRNNEPSKVSWAGMSFRIYRLAKKEEEKGGSEGALRKQ